MTNISAEMAEDLYCGDDGDQADGWTRITEIAHDARRWMQAHTLIIRDLEGAHWGLDYDLGLTEEQPHELPWRTTDPVPLRRMYPHTVTTTVYRSTPPADEG